MLESLLILVLAIAGATWFARGDGRRMARWGAAAFVLCLIVGQATRRLVFADTPSRAIGNAAYTAGEISWNRAAAIEAEDRSATRWSSGIALVTTLAIAAIARARRKTADGTPPETKRLVGAACYVCDRRIVMISDGARCAACGEPMHHACVARHASADESAYRSADGRRCSRA